jgi:flagellar hook-associated protein 2
VPVQIGSIVSGLPPNLVDKLIEAERQPIYKAEAKKKDVSMQLDLVRQLKDKVGKLGGGLYGMTDRRSFTDLKPTVSDPSILDAVVDKNIADEGVYRFEVLRLAEKSSAMSNGFPDKDESQVGVGFFSVTLPNGESRDIYIDSAHNTLKGMADLINQAGMGLKARVINDGSGSEEPWRLAVNSASGGNEGKVEFPTFYFLDGDQEFFFERFNEAQTAKVKMDGFEIEFEDNTIKELIPGVTIDLKRAQPGQIVTLKVQKDAEKISGKVKDFVDNTNAVLGFINKQNALDKDSNTRQTLGGDSSLQMLESRIRYILQESVPTEDAEVPSWRATDLGIEFQRDGLLKFDEKKFQAALERNYAAAANVFIGDRMAYGLVPRLKSVVSMANERGSGLLANREQGLVSRIKRIDDDIANIEKSVSRKADSIRKKFAALESSVGEMKSQLGAVGAIAGAGGGGGGSPFNLGGATVT